MFPEQYKKQIIEVYAHKKKMWQQHQHEKQLVRPYGEAAYFVLQAYDDLKHHPHYGARFTHILRVLDHHQEKGGTGFPKRNAAEKILALQSAVHILSDDSAVVRQNVYNVLTPALTDSQEEYVQAMVRPDFLPPSVGQTLKGMWGICVHDILSPYKIGDSVMTYYAAARKMKGIFNKGFSRL